MNDELSATKTFVESRVDAVLQNLGPDLQLTRKTPVRTAPLDIAIPIFNNAPAVGACLNSILPTLSTGDRVWLFDDASDDPDLRPLLDRFLLDWPDTRLSRSPDNLGFVAMANLAFDLTDRDLVLLNSDTEVLPNWLEFLQHNLGNNPRAGIVCPISDHATLLSVMPGGMPDAGDWAAAYSAGSVTLPTAVGFCMLISRQLIDQAGNFDPAFAPGYGEECDFSMRALKLGFDIQVADRAVVRHRGKGSFGSEESEQLQTEHQKLLDARWPEYRQLVQSWWQDNPLRVKTEFLARSGDDRNRVVHVLHRQYHIGGTERVTRGLIGELGDHYDQTLVYPGETGNSWCDFEQRPSELCRELMLNNRWILPETRLAGHGADLSCAHTEKALARIVKGSGAHLVHFHHLLHWDSLILPPLVRKLGAKVIISVHDFFFNCAIHNQLEYDNGQPCGRRFSRADDRCSRCLNSYAANRKLPGGAAPYANGRHAVIQHMLAEADAIIVPSHFMRRKILQAYDLPVRERLHVIPHGTDLPTEITKRESGDVLQIGYFGGDQVLKGARLIIELAQALADQPVHFRIYGRVKGFDAGQLTPNITLCGFYNPGAVGSAMAKVDLTVVPSHYEESFSLIVSESWAHGVPVLSSNRGALGERIVDGINGWTVPDLNLDSWVKAVKKLVDGVSIEEMKATLQNVRGFSSRESSQAVDAVYRKLLEEPLPLNNAASRGLVTTSFDRQLRRFRPRHIRKDASWLKRRAARPHPEPPRCIGIMRDRWGTAHYRLRFPLMELASQGWCENPVFHVVKEDGLILDDAFASGPFTHAFIQPFLSDEGLANMEWLSRQPNLQVVLVIDDLWTQLPDDNPVRTLMPPDIQDRLGYIASLSNQVIVTTPTLARLLGLRHPALRVIENALQPAHWTNDSERAGQSDGGRIRVGWAGAPQHGADLEILGPVMEQTRNEIDWVLLGMCPESLRPLVKEFQGMVPFDRYPRALAHAGLDLAVAPLADHAFNRCKSHLKVLEYGILGIPVIASDLEPYRQCPVIRPESNETGLWVDAIRGLASDSKRRKQAGASLREWVESHHLMPHRSAEWRSVIEEVEYAD